METLSRQENDVLPSFRERHQWGTEERKMRRRETFSGEK